MKYSLKVTLLLIIKMTQTSLQELASQTTSPPCHKIKANKNFQICLQSYSTNHFGANTPLFEACWRCNTEGTERVSPTPPG